MKYFLALDSPFPQEDLKHLSLADVAFGYPERINLLLSENEDFFIFPNAVAYLMERFPQFVISDSVWEENMNRHRRREASGFKKYETFGEEVQSLKEKDDDDWEPSWDRYGDSYASDDAGYDDDTIDSAFEGDPDNYWNID